MRRQFFHCGPARGTGALLTLPISLPLILSVSLALALPLALPVALTLALALLALRASKQLNFASDYFGGVPFLPLSILPLVSPQAAFDVNMPAFAEIISAKFRCFPKRDHPVPLCAVFPVSLTRGNPLICRQAETGDRNPVGAVSYIRVLTESSYQNDFIYGTFCHHFPFFD